MKILDSEKNGKDHKNCVEWVFKEGLESKLSWMSIKIDINWILNVANLKLSIKRSSLCLLLVAMKLKVKVD